MAKNEPSEESQGDQGGKVSGDQRAESAQPSGPSTDDEQPISKVTQTPGGARRDSQFKRRDYK